MSQASSGRLRRRRNPLRQFFSAGTWAATAYLVSYPLTAAVLFVVVLVPLVIGLVLSPTWFVLPVLLIGAWTLRACAEVERLRARLVGDRIRGAYASASGGLMDAVRCRWTDRATWGDAGYLIGLVVPLLILDVAVIAVWVALLGLITCPAWFWAMPQSFGDGGHTHGLVVGYLPDGPHSAAGLGLWIGSLPVALLTAAVAAVIAVGFSPVVVAAARLHRHVAQNLLGPRADPLAEARAVLARSPRATGARPSGSPLN